jgi:hypothetical protein
MHQSEILSRICATSSYTHLKAASNCDHIMYNHLKYLEDRWDPQSFEAECGVGIKFFHGA